MSKHLPHSQALVLSILMIHLPLLLVSLTLPNGPNDHPNHSKNSHQYLKTCWSSNANHLQIFELSSADAKRGVKSLPMKTLLYWRFTSASASASLCVSCVSIILRASVVYDKKMIPFLIHYFIQQQIWSDRRVKAVTWPLTGLFSSRLVLFSSRLVSSFVFTKKCFPSTL